jgi:hypothetical protein
MAGISFMSYIEGQRLAEQDNIRDEDRWRKQAAEDRAMQYADRDQAYKEKQQGYALDNYAAQSADRADATEIKEANRSVGEAYNMYAAAANAQGKKVWEVMLESQPFVVEGASPRKQALFDAGMREVVGTKIVHDMRVQGLYNEAGQLEERFGLAVNKSSRYQNTQRLMTDPEFASSELTKNGFTKNEDGTWTKMGVKVPAAIAIGVVANPESALPTLINQGRLNDVKAQRLGVANQVATINTTSQDRREWDYVAQQINAGVKKENIHPSYHAAYDKVMASRPTTTGAGSPPIAAASSIDTYTATPAASTPAPVAPAAIKNVAGPLSDWRTTSVPEALPNLQQARANINATTADLIAMTNAPEFFTPEKLATVRATLARQEQILKLVQAANATRFKTDMKPVTETRPTYVDVLNSRYK